MKTSQGQRFILITVCTLVSFFCFLNFKNQTIKIVFLIGGVVWAIAGLVNVIRLVINSKKNKNFICIKAENIKSF